MLKFKKVSKIWAVIIIVSFLFNSISYGVDTSNYAHFNNTLRPAMKFGKMGLEDQELSATRHRRYPTGWNEEALGRLAIDVLAVLAQQLKAGNVELQRENGRLKELAFTDKLTRLKNRPYYEEYLPRILDLASEQGFPVSMIAIDIDKFKDINDLFGHPTGDEVLKYVASCMADVVRSYDEIALVEYEDREDSTVARLGGEEFIIILPGTSLEDAKKVAERVRQRIEPMPDDKGNTHIRVGDRTLTFDRPVTVSLGVASFEKGSKREKAEHSLYQRADFALYVAKEDGRNRVRADDRLRAFMSEAMSLISRDVSGGPVVVNIQEGWPDLYKHLDKLVRIVNDIWEIEGKNYRIEIIDKGEGLVRVSSSEAEARSGSVLQDSVTAGKCL